MDKTEIFPVGLALSGGGAKGFAHLGVLKAMEEYGIRPDVISGTSAGALAGVLYADGYSPEEIASFFKNKDFTNFAEFSIPKAGLFKNNRFYTFLKKHLKARTFEELNIPLKVMATDIEHGLPILFEEGELIPAVIASCSYPIVFTPVKINGVHYIDGGVFKNFPVSVIRKQSKLLIGVNVTPMTLQKYKDSMLYVAERSFHYMSASNSLPDRILCDILIESTKIAKYATFSLDKIDEIFGIGYRIAKNKLKQNAGLLESIKV